MAAEPAALDQDSNRVWHGREAVVEIGDAFEVMDDTALDDQMSSAADYSAIVTEITLTDPEASVEVQNTFGGQVMSESPHDLVEIEFTARFQDIGIMEEFYGTASTVSNTSFTRISGGTTIGERPDKAILFQVEDSGGDKVNYLMNHAIFQQMGEISLAGDGAAEITGTAVCRVNDRYIENNFSVTY